MKCPDCGFMDSKVIDSRPTEDGSVIRRRRECPECAARFTTYERLEKIPVIVVKQNGERESFDREKLFRGILKALEKRPIALERVEETVSRIEKDIYAMNLKEVPSSKIGELAMRELKALDEVAYVRFASVYRRFEDVNSFMEELRNIIGNP